MYLERGKDNIGVELDFQWNVMGFFFFLNHFPTTFNGTVVIIQFDEMIFFL